MKEKLITMLHGFCMALADSVPGVSGGTVAFLLGFYDQFIGSLNDLLVGDMTKKKQALFYLIKLGIGWVIGMGVCAVVLSSVFTAHIYAISSLFIGFVLFAIPVVAIEEKKTLCEKPRMAVFGLLGLAIVVALTLFNTTGGYGMTTDNPTTFTYVYVFLVGAIAICAMVLPGISGSTLLLIFGIYLPIINAIKSFLSLDFSVVPLLLSFGIGVIVGVVAIVRAIRTALEKQRSIAVYLILGMMLGSLFAIQQGPTTLTDDDKISLGLDALGKDNFNLVFFLIGAILILGMQLLSYMRASEKKHD